MNEKSKKKGRKKSLFTILGQFLKKNNSPLYVIRKVRRKVKRIKRGSVRYQKHKEEARILITERILFWNTFYKFSYGRVSIRNQKTRWGSCSSKGNLNFSYRLVFLPMHLVDYIVVHELCHLKEFNHSENFWSLIERELPNYRKSKDELKAYGAKYVG